MLGANFAVHFAAHTKCHTLNCNWNLCMRITKCYAAYRLSIWERHPSGGIFGAFTDPVQKFVLHLFWLAMVWGNSKWKKKWTKNWLMFKITWRCRGFMNSSTLIKDLAWVLCNKLFHSNGYNGFRLVRTVCGNSLLNRHIDAANQPIW